MEKASEREAAEAGATLLTSNSSSLSRLAILDLQHTRIRTCIALLLLFLLFLYLVTGFSQPTMYKSVSILFLSQCHVFSRSIALHNIVARGFPAHAYTCNCGPGPGQLWPCPMRYASLAHANLAIPPRAS